MPHVIVERSYCEFISIKLHMHTGPSES
jgi:hypothetical protein